MTLFKILIADDERHIRQLIKDFLTNENIEVVEAKDGDDAIELYYDQSPFDLVILDVMMPKRTGYEICEEIRKVSDIPVIFLTALGDVEHEIKGFHVGADDYIAKPFELTVLLARVNAKLKLSNKIGKETIGSIEIDRLSHAVTIDQQPINLTPKEYDLLLYLIDHKNIALSRELLLDTIWGLSFYGDHRTVDTHIKQLRAKLGPIGDRITTVRGIGYKFEGES